MSRVRVFIACSLDGFIAGVDDDLSWLPEPAEAGDDFGFGAFIDEVGALLMGRRTFDVVSGFDGWAYGDRPVLVATRRPLSAERSTVRAVHGTIGEMIAGALHAADGRDVYIDGGNLIRQALVENLIDELVITLVPTVLGEGISLFSGASRRVALELVEHRPLPGGMLQLIYRPLRQD